MFANHGYVWLHTIVIMLNIIFIVAYIKFVTVEYVAVPSLGVYACHVGLM